MLKRRSGLGQLIPGADLSTPGGATMVPISAIAVNPYQPRRTFAPEALAELSESIRLHGILQPLTVRLREGGYELIAGERRLQAARHAGMDAVPVLLRACTDREMLALALVENLQREDLNPLEAAQSYQQLMDEFHLTQAEVAEQVGKSRSAVANTLRLLALPAHMQQAVREGAMSEGHARALLAVSDDIRQEELFHETLTKKLSVRALESLVNPRPRETARRGDPTIDPNTRQALSLMQAALGLRVRLKPGSRADRGTLEIEFYTAEDLDRLYELLTR